MTLRSLMLGDCNHYASPYMRGIAQAMKLLGHAHNELSIRSPARVIDQKLRLWKPDLIWTHMLLWPPPGAPPGYLHELTTCPSRSPVRPTSSP